MKIYSSLRDVLRATFAAIFVLSAVTPISAQTTPVVPLTGTVIDSNSGLPIANASVSANGPSSATVSANRDGRFSFPALQPGIYTLTARADGYQTALSDAITVVEGSSATATLNLQRLTGRADSIRTIGRSAVNGAQSLEKASVLYQSINSEQVTEQGLYRLSDALRQLPGIINSGSDTATPGDDVSLNFRGIGNLETLTLLDGHPVAYGLPGQYNFDISPTAIFRNVQAVYGSGADQFYPINAIGGVFDFQTIDPTLKPRATVQQQYGTFSKLGTTVTATGTVNGIGYAFVAGSTGIDGPLKHNHSLYSYSSSLDPGSLDPNIHAQSFYDVDESTVTRTFLGKLVVPIDSKTKISLTGLTEKFYDRKTGNGDLDFSLYQDVFNTATTNAASAQNYLLYSNNPAYIKDPNNPAQLNSAPLYIPGDGQPMATVYQPQCPNGYVVLNNGNGIPSGTYSSQVIGVPVTTVYKLDKNGNPILIPGTTTPRNFGPLPYSACVTPKQYATQFSGLNGAGSDAFQTFNIQDFHAHLSQQNGGQEAYVDAYVDDYLRHYARDFQAPYFDVPGDNPNSDYTQSVNSGLTVGSTWTTPQNSAGIGLFYNNSIYGQRQAIAPIGGSDSPFNVFSASDFSVFLRESYKLPTIPLTLYANVWNKTAGETQTSYFDPRIAAVFTLKNDVFRVSEGASSTQPDLSQLKSPFVPAGIAGFNGSINGACGTAATNPIAIGSSGASTSLTPERGVDTEVGYAHRFFGDSQIQATFYNTNVYNQINGFTAPLSIYGTAGIDPGYLANVEADARATCGASFDVNNGLGVSSTVNVGTLRSQGVELAGRQRIIRKVALDYDYDANSTKYTYIPLSLQAANSSLIPGAQLPQVPQHQYNLALNYEFVPEANFRVAYHHIATNNTKNLGPYGYADAEVAGGVGPGRLAIAVNNLFNSEAFFEGIYGHGVPIAQNQFGGAPAPTERFGLPFRTITLTFTASTK